MSKKIAIRKTLSAVKPCIHMVARKAGVKLSVRGIHKYVWNGKTIATRENNGDIRPDENIVHDVAHYVVASQTRRKRPEFGLGRSPDSGTADVELLLTHANAQLEEEEASILGILIEQELGLDSEGTFDGHSWVMSDGSLPTLLQNYRQGKVGSTGLKTLARLRRKGHITASLKPKVLRM